MYVPLIVANHILQHYKHKDLGMIFQIPPCEANNIDKQYCTLPCKNASSLEGNLSNFMSGISQETSMKIKIKINDLMNQSTTIDHCFIPLNPMFCIAMVL